MIQLNYRDARPIYEQVRDGLRHLVVTGALQAGDKLPSVRALASSLAINPNTIQRAYESLEQEGYLYTVAGKGSFAAPQADVNAARRDRLLREKAELYERVAEINRRIRAERKKLALCKEILGETPRLEQEIQRTEERGKEVERDERRRR